MSLLRLLIVLTLSFLAIEAHSKSSSKLGFSIEPVVGYEREVKVIPTIHTTERFFYGARLIAGYPLLSAEAEYTKAQDSESFPTQDLSTKDNTDKLKVGIRSTPAIGKILFLTLRGGVQAEKNIHEQTTGGVTTTTEQAIEYDPYFGTGVRVMLGKKMSLAFDITGVLTDLTNFSNFEPQASAGISIKLP